MFSKFRLAAMAAGLGAVVIRRIRAGRHQDPLHARLEAPGHPRLVLLGAGEGLFRGRKLDVTIDQGEGSAATVTRIMSGAYDAGFGDMNAIIQNAATKPAEAPLMVYMIYSKAPFALLTKATSPIQSFKDLAGKKLGSPPGGASLKLLPLMAKKNNVDSAEGRCHSTWRRTCRSRCCCRARSTRSRSSPPRAT